MTPHPGQSPILTCLSALALLGAAISPATAQNPPATIDLKSIKVDVVDDVIIPIPQEIFASLDKLGDQNWAKHLEKRNVKLDGNRSRTAFLFGLVISEGFIAVQAQNTDEVKRIGREVLTLSGALAVKGAVEGHALAIIEGADRSEWASVRRELDKTRQTVINTMKELSDDDLADLVSIGGWLGGTRALAALVADNYSADASELLHQPDLLDQIANRFAGLPTKSKQGASFTKVGETLESLKPLMRVNGDGAVLQDAVIEIQKLSTDLTSSFYGN
ncbi:MAG: hypothetical protein JNK37_15480 [Verrucomicrobiales bacterium]|nr:hypothetical protein [Verrucomicrobiales bacterium]